MDYGGNVSIFDYVGVTRRVLSVNISSCETSEAHLRICYINTGKIWMILQGCICEKIDWKINPLNMTVSLMLTISNFQGRKWRLVSSIPDIAAILHLSPNVRWSYVLSSVVEQRIESWWDFNGIKGWENMVYISLKINPHLI